MSDHLPLSPRPSNSMLILFISLIVCVSVASRIYSAQHGRNLLKTLGSDTILDDYARRLAPLAADLRDVQRLSYVQPSEPGQPVDSSEAWVLAQYVLAPIVLTCHNQEEIILVDCLSPGQLQSILNNPQYKIIKVYEQGIILAQHASTTHE